MKKEKPESYQIIAIVLFFISTYLGFCAMTALNPDLSAGLGLIVSLMINLPIAVIIHGIGEIVKQLKILNDKNKTE